MNIKLPEDLYLSVLRVSVDHQYISHATQTKLQNFWLLYNKGHYMIEALNIYLK